MWVYRGVLPHLEVFTRRAEDHLLQDEAPDEGVEGEVGKPHNPREDARHKEAWKCQNDADVNADAGGGDDYGAKKSKQRIILQKFLSEL